MCLDLLDFHNLTKAAESVNGSFHYNLQYHTISPQWECKDCGVYELPHHSHVKACEGFKLGLTSGKIHGPAYNVCMKCNDSWGNYVLLEDEVKTNRRRITRLKILREHAPVLADRYGCASTKVKLHLCRARRARRPELRSSYWERITEVAQERPEIWKIFFGTYSGPERHLSSIQAAPFAANVLM